jgi:hypothetical protein
MINELEMALKHQWPNLNNDYGIYLENLRKPHKKKKKSGWAILTPLFLTRLGCCRLG